MPPQRDVYGPLISAWGCSYQGKINPMYRMLLELERQRSMSRNRFGREHDARGVLVQAVNNSPAVIFAYTYHLRPCLHQGLHERNRTATRGGVHHQPRWLIHYNQIVIFKNYSEIRDC